MQTSARKRNNSRVSGDAVASTFYQAASSLLAANSRGEIAALATGTWWPRGPLDIERHGQAVVELRKEIKALSRVLLLAETHFRHAARRRGRPRAPFSVAGR